MIDTLAVITAFPTFVYHIEKPEFLVPVRTVMTEYLGRQKAPGVDALYPVRMTENLNDPRLQGFMGYIGRTSANLLTEHGYAMDGMATRITSLWAQEHHKHSAMDPHVHPGGHIIGFYFVDVPDNCSVAVFHDPRAGKVMGGVPERDTANITYASDRFPFMPKPGVLLFADAWLPHSFTRHAADTPIRFVHFNVSVVEAVQAPAEVI